MAYSDLAVKTFGRNQQHQTREGKMKAIVVSQYGGPEVLEYKEIADPSPGPDEVLIRVAAASINPFDLKQRSGELKEFAPIAFPGVLGIDVSGTVISCGEKVQGFTPGDRVFGMADQTYAELCVAKATSLVKVPASLDLVEAAAIPLVTTTGHQLISNGASVKQGQSVLVTGALGSVGRSAAYVAKLRGATVIAGVRKKQCQEAEELGVDNVLAVDDADAVKGLQLLDAVADTVDGATAALLMGKVQSGGIFASVLGPPKNSGQFPAVTVIPVFASPDSSVLSEMSKAVAEGRLSIPIAAKMSLKEAGEGHILVAKGTRGKVLLLP
jgi:NADPH:quinone reductase-like Zn-dependent oxidoreductase